MYLQIDDTASYAQARIPRRAAHAHVSIATIILAAVHDKSETDYTVISWKQRDELSSQSAFSKAQSVNWDVAQISGVLLFRVVEK